MCGINGFTWKNRDLIERMNAATNHRGPDGSRIFFDENVSLGHNRLAIIDLSEAGAQPRQSPDGALTIVFNGEIYNFEALRRELASKWKFQSRTDTEVIVAAYAVWGKKCVERLNGMFAFAIWDKNRRELFLARDPIGIKPLYYFYDGTKFIFSSEIKAILEHEDIPRTLDREAFAIYLRTLYVPSPMTMFQYIRKLPPGHTATLKGPGLHIEKYWSVENTHVEIPADRVEQAKQLKDTIEGAVSRQLVSDRPVGVYLSGGLDSSIVLASTAAVHGSIDTFSVGFDLNEDEQAEKFNADSSLAERTADFFSARHHAVTLSAEEVPDLFEKAVFHLDEPISNPTALAQMKLAEFTRRSVAVALSGDGGDELFGGYERFRLSALQSEYQKYVPGFLRHGAEFGERLLNKSDHLQKIGVPAGVSRFALFLFQKDPTLRAVVDPQYAGDTAERFFEKEFFTPIEKDFERQFMNVDRQSWLVDECLIRGDKTTMSAGLEMRVPLLDLEVVEYAWAIPTVNKVNRRENKILLREAFRERLPAYLFEEPKRGWFSPAAKWLRRPHMVSFANEILSPTFYPETNTLFNFEGIETMLKNHQEHREYNLTMIWALLTFQLWARRYGVQL